MERIFLTDESGKFFDFENVEAMYRTHLTDDDPDDDLETLYNTCKGNWVLASREFDSVIQYTPEIAAEWFVFNGWDFDEIPEELMQYVGEEI